MSVATQCTHPNSGFPSFYMRAFTWSRESAKPVAKVFAFLGNESNTKALSSLEPKAVSIPQYICGSGKCSQQECHANQIIREGDVIKLCKNDRLREAFHLLQRMDYPHFSTYASLLQGCINGTACLEGKLVHAHILQTGFEPDTFLETKLMIMYAKGGCLSEARQLFDKMPQRNVVSWNAMIGVYANQGFSEEALSLLCQMQTTGIQPDHFTFSGVLPACADLAALRHGEEIHRTIILGGIQFNIFVASALIDMYIKSGSIEDARKVFDKMPERNVVSWNTMLSGYAHSGYVDDALKLFQIMPERNVISWTAMITGYAQSGHVDEAFKLFQEMPVRNEVCWTAMITAYAQNGYVHEARELFHKIPQQNVISWSALISGYAMNGLLDETLELFRQMQRKGPKANSVTFVSILPVCANLSALNLGKEVHEDIIINEVQSVTIVGNALIDMYAKCGSLEDACGVFDKMPRRNVVSWTAIIVGHAIHGQGKKALKLFEHMRNSHVKPNHVTFVGVLSACCHAGLVNDGWQYLNCMSRDYNMQPGLEHYSCMVDLLGRAGLLDEAHNLINKMPIKPDAAVWGSLLLACRIHSNVDLGEHVAGRLFETDPENAARYIMLSNIYAEVGRWDDVKRVRKMMNDMRVTKIPGCSWTEVKNQVYGFLT